MLLVVIGNLRIHGLGSAYAECVLLVFGGWKNVSVGRAGIDPLTVRYTYILIFGPV